MTDEETPRGRAPDSININVLRVRNLRGSKGETLSSLVKVEYNGNSLGESVKVDSALDAPAEYNFNAKLDGNFEDPVTLDEIAYKPVVVTITEVLPKEKKQKEEKTTILGMCSVGLLPLVQGQTKFKCTMNLFPVPGSPLDSYSPDLAKPEIDIVVSVDDPLITEEKLQMSNLLTITMESLYSTPDTWNPTTSAQYNFNATMPIPITSEKESTVVVTNGALKAANDKDPPSKQKKWCLPGTALAASAFIPDSYVQPVAYEDEQGELRDKEDRDFRIEAESDKNRVTWNTERRCFMAQSALQNFQSKIAHTRVWPVEVVRTGLQSAAKGGKGKDEDSPLSFHGVAYVNLAPLLYPGVKEIRGAYRVWAFNEQEVFEKTKRKGGLAEEAVRIATAMTRGASPYNVKGKKEDKGKDKKQPPASLLKASDTASETDATPQNVEGQQYTDAHSYIVLSIELERPLVPKRPLEELASKVAAYIPPRPLFPRRTNGAEKAVEDFRSQVASVSNMVLEEFRKLFANQLKNGQLPAGTESIEERRQELLYEINTSGKYFAFKEQLKHSVIKIVREKYLKTTSFESPEQLQAFLSDLYVFLVDQMHLSLGKVLSLEDETPVPAPVTDCAQLKHFAREAEVNENFELASKYYQERLARNRNDPNNWFDYGTFNLLTGDVTRAEECFKETISINQQHLEGLLMYGIIATMEERHEVAETFFESATRVDPTSVVAWTLLGLFYDAVSNNIQCEFAFQQAIKVNMANAKAAQLAVTRRGYEQDGESSDLPLPQMDQASEKGAQSESALQVPMVTKTPATPTDPDKAGQQNPLSTRPPSKDKSVVSTVKKRTSISSKSGEGLTRTKSAQSVASQGGKGHQSESRQQSPNHMDEEPPPREPTPEPESSIFMATAEFLLEVNAMQFCEKSLSHELLSPVGGPSAPYFVCLARLKLQKKEFSEAEDALNEALALDHQNPDAWSIMGHLHYLTGDYPAAKDCYQRTVSFVADAREMHAVYLRLASIYLQDSQHLEAKRTFLVACKNSPSCVSWLGVGIACYRLGELSDAEDALSEANILNNTDPEVWGYLSLVCLQTGRQLEAEQAYKYAVKLNLPDQDLLNEIHQVQEELGFGNPQF